MRICINLDGTISEFCETNESYADVLPKKGAKKFIDYLHKQGHIIIIYTTRNLQSQNHNMGRITIEWLGRHHIYYDEIFFGKPNADIIIDDRAIRFESWLNLTEKILIDSLLADLT